MSEQKKIPFLTNDQEIECLKKAFAGNENLLISVRALLLGFPVDDATKEVIRQTFKDASVKEAFRKKIYPMLAPDSMIGEGGDYWFGTDNDIIGRDEDTIRQIVISKGFVLKLFEQAFKLLDDPSGPAIDLSFDPELKSDKFGIALLVRNKYINSINTGLMMVKIISGQKDETVEEAKNRLFKNSNK